MIPCSSNWGYRYHPVSPNRHLVLMALLSYTPTSRSKLSGIWRESLIGVLPKEAEYSTYQQKKERGNTMKGRRSILSSVGAVIVLIGAFLIYHYFGTPTTTAGPTTPNKP